MNRSVQLHAAMAPSPPMATTRPLQPLFRTALRSPGTLSDAAIRALLTHVLGGFRSDAGALYSRPELSADDAALIWDQHAESLPNPAGTSSWAARALMRPESHPEALTTAAVTAWPASVAASVAELVHDAVCVVPANVAIALMSRPEQEIALRGAGTCPAHPGARAVIDAIGASAAAVWPGLVLPGVGSGPGQNALLGVLALVGEWWTPTALQEFAAADWASPAALSTLDLARLSPAGVARVAKLWLLPAVSGAFGEARELASASVAAVAGLDPANAAELAAAWRTGTSLRRGLEVDEHAELVAAFAGAGAPIVGPIAGEPVCPLHRLSEDQRDELLVMLEARVESHPGIWAALEAALLNAGTAVGTFGELLDALEAVDTPAAGT